MPQKPEILPVASPLALPLHNANVNFKADHSHNDNQEPTTSAIACNTAQLSLSGTGPSTSDSTAMAGPPPPLRIRRKRSSATASLTCRPSHSLLRVRTDAEAEGVTPESPPATESGAARGYACLRSPSPLALGRTLSPAMTPTQRTEGGMGEANGPAVGMAVLFKGDEAGQEPFGDSPMHRSNPSSEDMPDDVEAGGAAAAGLSITSAFQKMGLTPPRTASAQDDEMAGDEAPHLVGVGRASRESRPTT